LHVSLRFLVREPYLRALASEARAAILAAHAPLLSALNAKRRSAHILVHRS
jgi:hypothetical protein